MSELVANEYDDANKAHEVRLAMLKLQRDYLIDLEDAVVAVKNDEGKVMAHSAGVVLADFGFSSFSLISG